MRYQTFALAAITAAAAPALAQDREFIFAPAGGSYTAAIFGGDPLIGQEVIQARILLTITVNPGGDAALFNTDLALPIEPFPGNTNVVVITGIGEGWSGSGTFNIDRYVTIHNGIFRQGLFGGETVLPNGFVHEGSVVQVFVPAPAAAPLLAGAGVLAMRRRRR